MIETSQMSVETRKEIRSGSRLRIPGWIRILRPLNLAMIFSGCLIGRILVDGAAALSGNTLLAASLAGLSVALIAGSGNITNDLLDLPADKINRRDRPLPSGQLSLGTARIMVVITAILALGIAWLLSPLHFFVILTFLLLLSLYNWRLKRIVLVGNAVVALLIAASLAYGALGSSPTTGGMPFQHIMGVTSIENQIGRVLSGGIVIAMGFAFVLSLAREIVKDISDMNGDRQNQSRSFPIQAGVPRSIVVIRVMIWGVLLSSPLPYLLQYFPGLYLLLILPVMASLIRALLLLKRTPIEPSQVSTQLKWTMAYGLLSLGASAIWPA